jgi:uncharacterized protein YciI
MWYLVLSRNDRSAEERAERTPSHLDWLVGLHRGGRALFSGQTADGGYGVYILLAPDLPAARALAAQDPYHLAGDRHIQDVLEWAPKRALRMDGPTVADIEAMARGS